MQSASWGNAGTLGVSKQTTPLSKTPSNVSASLRQSWGAKKSEQSSGAGVFFDSATLMDPYFWLWGLTFLRAFFGNAHVAFLDTVWRDLNHEAQRALFDVAKEEGLLEEADLRIDGRCVLKTAAHESAAASADATAAAETAETAAAEAAAKMALLRTREPKIEIGRRIVSLELSEQDAQGSCSAYSQGLARVSAAKYGATFEVGVAARSLLKTASGRVCGVRTEGGKEVRADAVVLCAGACAAPLAATAGLYVPVQPLRGYSFTARVGDGSHTGSEDGRAPTAGSAPSAQDSSLKKKQDGKLQQAAALFGLVALLPPEPPPSVRTHLTFAPSSLYVTRLGDTLRFTCFGEMSPVCADGPGPPTRALFGTLRRLVESEVPNVRELCDWEHAVEWHGCRPLTPDSHPLSGRTRVPGLYLNVGHSFNGWREATVSARVVADAVSGSLNAGAAVDGTSSFAGGCSAPEYTVRAFDPARFRLW